MRLKYLVAIGAALVFVMLMANGVNGESDYPDDQRIIIAIDNSVSMNMSDPGCTRIERAKCFLSNKFNNNTSGTNWFALLIPRENSDTLVGGSEPYRYGVVNNSTLLTKNFSDIIRNLSEQESYICYNPTTSITNFALFLSDGVIMTFDKGKGPEKHFVFFSNGNITDNISAVTRAKNNGIKIDTIGFGDNQDNLKNLELISKETNGTYYYWNIDINITPKFVSVPPGSPVSFTINVTNKGNSNLRSVVVIDTLPSGLEYAENVEMDGRWCLGLMKPNDSETLLLEARINDSAPGILVNSIKAEGTVELDGTWLCDNVTDVDTATVRVIRQGIEVNKTANQSSGAPSTQISFTINVTNTGEVDFVDVEVKDTLPEGLDYVSDNRSGNNVSQNVTWNLGPLNASNSTCIELVAHIDGLKFGNLTNNITVTGVPPTGYNVTNSSSAVVTAVNASIEVNKMADPKKGSPSTNVTFTINVTNTGEVDFVDVEVKDTLSEGLDYVSDNRSGNNVSQNVTWNLGPLNASNSTYIELVAHIDGSKFGNLTNFVEVEGKPEHGNNVLASGSVTINLSNNGTYLVFALDTSGSMKKYYRMAKNEGAEIVTGLSHFDNANVSIVSWDHESEIIFGPAPLEGSEDRLAEILGNLSGMCIETDLTEYDQGLNGSLAVLRDHAAESAASEKIIVFLTGFSEFEPGERLGDYISEANESGYRIFTIGIGINSSFNATQKQYSNLTKISNGAGGEFYYVTAFSSEELKPVMADITRVAEGNLRSADSGT